MSPATADPDTLREEYSDLKDEVLMFWDGGDPYGSLMSAWFPLAAVLTFERDSRVPTEEWDYRPGGLGSLEHEEDLYVDTYRQFSTEVLEKLGRVFARYYDLCKRAGVDY